MCPAEAEPPQAGAAGVSPGSEGAKSVTSLRPPTPPGPAAPNTEAVETGAAATAENDAVAGAEAQRETSCGSSGTSVEIGASAPEDAQPTSAGTAAQRRAAPTAQTATAEHEKDPPADSPGENISAFVDVLFRALALPVFSCFAVRVPVVFHLRVNIRQHDLNAAVQRVEAGRLLLERLRGALLQQAAAASAFAASLNVAAESLKPLSTESRTCAAAAQSYSCLLGNSALQAKELCDALRRDVVASTLERTIENHAQVLKQAMEKYLRCSKMAAAAAETAQASLSMLPSTKTELALQCIRLCVEARQAEEAYVASVQVRLLSSLIPFIQCLCLSVVLMYLPYCDCALQQRSKATRERVQSILACLEEMDLKRMQCLRDALTRAGVFVAANLRHMQYDLERSIQSVEGVDPEKDLRDFVDERRPHTPPSLSLPTVSLAAYSIGTSDATTSDETERQLRGGTVAIPGLPSPPDAAVVQRLQDEYSELQLRLLGVCCDWLLTAADTQLDAWAGRQLLLLAVEIAAPGTAAEDPQQHQQWDWKHALEQQQQLDSSICSDVESKRQEIGCHDQSSSSSITNENSIEGRKQDHETSLTTRCVYHHRYWNRVTFWEEALALTVSEELQRQKLSEKWQSAGPEVLQEQERLFREKNPCCSSLPSFGSFMSLYGIATEQVQSLLISVSKHLNLDEQTSEMLLHGVADATSSQGQLLATHGDTGRRGSSSNGNCTSNISSTTNRASSS
ncbi:hypothetical protein, conserved [Eimeria praecox]|uniref:Uncharacterized protein n=1 Tax=Eimeria praecox TaxID=51316 RepID=U6G1E9_9EIME|nr:hypothetical protein, conserved [Eimeria praecox]